MTTFTHTRQGKTLEDSLGKMIIPPGAYYGINTQRALENFPITNYQLHPELIKSLAMVKKAAACANERALETKAPGIFKHIVKACDAIIEGYYHEHFVVDPIQGGAGTSLNMNTNEVIANIALVDMGHDKHLNAIIHPNDHINMSQSTNDVIPTAARICIRKLLDELLSTMCVLCNIFREKADEFDDVVKMGRTHLQDAVPIRLGQEFDAYRRVIERDIDRINNTGNYLFEVNLGATAVGTALNANPRYIREVIGHLREITEISSLRRSESLVDGTQNTDCFTEVSAALKICALNMSKIANDLRLMASGPHCGLGEITLEKLQPGSSIMPEKVNPIIPELINQVAYQVIGNDLTVSLASEAGQFELNVMQPVLIYNLIQSVGMMNNAFRVFGERCVRRITLTDRNRARIKSYVDNSPIIATALAPYIGYERAGAIARIALAERTTALEICLMDDTLVKRLGGEESILKILDPDGMTRMSERMEMEEDM
ncbi:MAG: aspartate ammonia-lyase [Defluviitaleaceae bacterium]|nr:aspartate ammonia-lyase [Defluviitaleaceae bacterium]MCL2238419.1 aspartate ammonia-lyase [Defluviitaleaceae bacterium]